MATITAPTHTKSTTPTIKASYPPRDWLPSMRPEAEIRENLRQIAVRTMFRSESGWWYRWLERIEVPRWAVRWEVDR